MLYFELFCTHRQTDMQMPVKTSLAEVTRTKHGHRSIMFDRFPNVKYQVNVQLTCTGPTRWCQFLSRMSKFVQTCSHNRPVNGTCNYFFFLQCFHLPSWTGNVKVDLSALSVKDQLEHFVFCWICLTSSHHIPLLVMFNTLVVCHGEEHVISSHNCLVVSKVW